MSQMSRGAGWGCTFAHLSNKYKCYIQTFFILTSSIYMCKMPKCAGQPAPLPANVLPYVQYACEEGLVLTRFYELRTGPDTTSISLLLPAPPHPPIYMYLDVSESPRPPLCSYTRNIEYTSYID